MSWADEEEDNKEQGNTDRVYEIQEELDRTRDEFLDIKEKFLILEPRAINFRKAIDKWYPKQLRFLTASRTLLGSLREEYDNPVDPAPKLEEGLNEMCSVEDNTGAKFKTSVGNDMLQSIDDYIKDCKFLSRSVDKWQKSCSSVEHYIKKVLELSTNLNVAYNTGKDKIARKLSEKFTRNLYKLNKTAKVHGDTHDEVKSELTKFWDAREDFFDMICKDLLFWQQCFLRGQGDAIVKSLKSLGLNTHQIDEGAEKILNQKKSVKSKKDNTDVKEEAEEQDLDGDFNEDDVQWAEEPTNKYEGW